MITRVGKYLGGLGVDTTGIFYVASNSTLTIGNGADVGNVASGAVFSGGVELRSNDYSTYTILNSSIGNVNSNVTALQGGIAGSNAAIISTQAALDTKDTIANVYLTYTTLAANDSATLLSAYSNDGSTLLSARSNDYTTYTTLTTNYSANDVVTLTAAYANDFTTYTTLSNSITSITSLPVTFQSDVTIQGNLFLTGSNTILVSNTISLGDSLISLASNNTVNDVIDIGLYGHYWNGNANSHAGLVRSHVSKDWMLFSNYTIDLEGNTTVNIADPSFGYANLRLAAANATAVYSNGVELRANDYATLLSAYSNDGATLLSARSNDYSTYVVLSSNINTVQSNLDSFATYANSNFAAASSGAASVVQDNLNIFASNAIANTNLVQSNLTSFAAYTNAAIANSTANTGLVRYSSEYTTTSSNSYFIGTSVATTSEVDVYIDGVYQNKSTFVLDNAASNVKFTDSSISVGRLISIETYKAQLIGSGIGEVRYSSDLANVNSNINASLLSARSNDYTTYTTLAANDSATLLSAYSNDSATLLSARSNDYSTYTTLNTSINTVQSNLTSTINTLGNIPQNSKTSSYTLQSTDNGKHISITTGGVTVPNTTFSIGDSVVIYNNSVSNQTITQGVNVTLRLVGTATTGNRTLAQYGLSTILCVAGNTFVAMGGGLT